MKKTLVSLAAVAALSTGAMAADKGIDIVTTGQAVLYYQTSDAAGASDLFDHDTNSAANVAVQLNLNADLGNNFSFGSQLSYLGTAGLEKVLVGNTMQNTSGQATVMNGLEDEIAMTKIFVAKQIANTTVKIGRQELPKSLSPLAFSEGWNVFKNTFEAVLVVNSDIPDTTVVAAYVGQSNSNGNLGSFNNLTPATQSVASNVNVAGAAYMLTVQNKSLPMTTATLSYYAMENVRADVAALSLVDAKVNSASAVWVDAKIADKSLPMGLKVGIQAGSIMTDHALLADTTAFGIKIGAKPMDALTLCAAYTSVDGDDDLVNVAVKNVGTGIKTPLYTQMVANQNAISLDGGTAMLKAAYSLGDAGTVIAQVTSTSAGKSNLAVADGETFTDAELLYKVKAGGVSYLAAYVNTKDSAADDSNQIIRLWARKAF